MVSPTQTIAVPLPEPLGELASYGTAEANFLTMSLPLLACTLVLIIKNEGKYVREWIEYHRHIGVDHFVIFDNGSTDGLEAIVSPYVSIGLVTYMGWDNIISATASDRKQRWIEQDTAYAGAVRLLNGRSRWVGFIDIDEFVVLDGTTSLPSYLDGLNTPSVNLYWRMFGTSGIADYVDDLVTSRFLYRASDPASRLGKIFARPEQVHLIRNAHKFYVGVDRTIAIHNDGTRIYDPASIAPSYDGAVIHHYHTRSAREYQEKVQRGWPDNDAAKNEKWQEHLRLFDRNEVEDRSLAVMENDIRTRMANMGAAIVDDVIRVTENWLCTLSPTLMVAYRQIAVDQHWVVEGFVVDPMRPNRKWTLQMHDGFGRLRETVTCDQRRNILSAAGIGDGRYGFTFKRDKAETLHLCADEFSFVIAPHSTTRDA